MFFNFLLSKNILDQFKLKWFAEGKKVNMAEKFKFYWGSAENVVGKGENAGHQHFLLFPQCLQKTSDQGP